MFHFFTYPSNDDIVFPNIGILTVNTSEKIIILKFVRWSGGHLFAQKFCEMIGLLHQKHLLLKPWKECHGIMNCKLPVRVRAILYAHIYLYCVLSHREKSLNATGLVRSPKINMVT